MYTPIMLDRIIDRLCPKPINIDSKEYRDMVDMICDADYIYNNFDQIIIEYQVIQEEGGWPQLTREVTLRLGSNHPEVAILAERLEITGDLVHPHTDGNQFTEIIDVSVRLFQERHGLVADGIVGRNTRASMNIVVERRLEQLAKAKEIWDQIPKEEKKVVVNVPGFRTIGTNEFGHPEIDIKTIVGKVKHQTPVFKDQIEYAMVNPYWNIPFSIAVEEILPEIKKAHKNKQVDAYFNRKGYELFRGGRKVVPSQVSWGMIRARNFPFTLRQVPSESNMLGKAKFMFPNAYSMYLHDTPFKHLFNNRSRAFSHGCMRLQEWRKMFEFLFPEVTNDELVKIMLTNKETRIELEKPVPVYITYMLAWVEEGGHVHFYKDVYDKY